MYKIQGVAPKKHKEASVHRLLMLLAVPDVQELHSNLKILLGELGLEMLDFVVTSDIKIGTEHSVCRIITYPNIFLSLNTFFKLNLTKLIY